MQNINLIKKAIWSQFGASIDMLHNVIATCPEGYFEQHKRFYYIAYHTVVFLDYYLSIPPTSFDPKLPFTFTDAQHRPVEAIDDLIPDRIYNKEELLSYIDQSSAKCRIILENLSNDTINDRFIEDFDDDAMDYPILEILLYNMRHVRRQAYGLGI
jgi:hypothetical protein